jgi:tetratricopeptide (TPR) repeat protein
MPAGPALRLLALGIIVIGRGYPQDRALDEAARLDAEQKCDAAEQVYQSVLARGRPSPALLNNLGNHYLTCGAPEKARAAFELLLKTNPAHVNANLQLARLETGRNHGAKALEYLSRIKEPDAEILLVRAEALHQAGKPDAAAAALAECEKKAGDDPRLVYALGMTCARIGLYERAETAFSAVLARYPDDFDVLYNLGLAAALARHYERAQHAFEVALKVRPADVESLYEMGRVETNLHDYTRAVYLLAQARKLAPQRPDILLALARAAQMAGFYGDCLLAYDEYLKLRPADDMVRRDRALVNGAIYGYIRVNLEESIKDLTWYVERHPSDPIGFYNLAQVTERTNPVQSMNNVSAAIKLDPKFEPARYFRALLLQKMGRTEESLAELESAIRLDPHDAHALDLQGLDYLNIDKPAEASQALRQALAQAPDDPDILFHLGRSLMELGRAEEARPFLDRFAKLRQAPTRVPRETPGMIEAANLSAAERSQRMVEQLRQRVQASPNDPSLQLNLGATLLIEGSMEEAAATFRTLLALDPPGAISYDAGRTLLRYEQYALARDFLRRAAAGTPEARLDLAMALYFTDGSQQALAVLDQAPPDHKDGDQRLMKAWILDAAGRTTEADKILEESLNYSVARPRLAQEAALLFVRHKQNAKALDMIGRASKLTPDDAGILLTRVVVLCAMGRNAEAEKAVREIENRWPEWDRPYLVEGLLMEHASRPDDARRRIQIALALGAQDSAARCALNRIAAPTSSDPDCVCQTGLYEVFFPGCSTK